MIPIAPVLEAVGEKMPWRIIFVVAVVVGSFGAGWVANGWRKDSVIEKQKADRSEEIRKQASDALLELSAATKIINQAAKDANVDSSNLNAKLDKIERGMKNAKPPVLPSGCVIDPIRLRSITEAADAVNQAAVGSKPSGAVQADQRP